MTAKISGDPTIRSNLETVHRFDEAFELHDADGVMAAITEDCVFEDICPPPDGERYAGQYAVRTFPHRFSPFPLTSASRPKILSYDS